MTNDTTVQNELDTLLLPWSEVSTRSMFGGHAYFVGDRLFACYYKGAVAAKLPDPDRTQALDSGRAKPFTPHPGRPFGEWVEFPVEESGGVEALVPLLETAFEYVKMTPLKGRKASGRSG